MIKTELLELEISDSVYKPREDSYLLLRSVIAQNTDAVEIGCGTGLTILSLGKKYNKNRYFAIDLNFDAALLTMKNAKHNDIENVQIISGDHLKSFRKNALPNTVISNPPYLPENPELDRILPRTDFIQFVGGKKGYEFTMEIIEYLSDKYIFFVIISSLAINPEVLKGMYPMKIIDIIEEEIMDDGEKLWVLKIRGEKNG